ncbi:Purine and other phosphorylases, family 1 [Syntrophobacter sp. SbD1]|nr:Purine and other phosphorylases, family 1 [Syntrophobacter sp. SbD1]
MERIDLVILGATPGEIAPFPVLFKRSISAEIAGNPFSIYNYRDLKLLIMATGLGKVNAAAISAAVLSRFRAGEVWNVGCAGAYLGSGLEIGDVLISESCICADEGILGKDGPMPAGSLEIPLVVKNGQPFYDCFPLGEALSRRRVPVLLPAGAFDAGPSEGFQRGDAGGAAGTRSGFGIQYGPSLTVGMASGDIQTADARFRRFRALAENMEGSAIAQTCLLLDVPFLELRGISNIAGVRDKTQWDLGAAIRHCAAVVMRLLDKQAEGD